MARKKARDTRLDDHRRGKLTRSTPTAEMIEQRARELASIDSRSAEHVTDDDREQARRELGVEGISPEPDETETIVTGQWDPAPGSTGHQAPTVRPVDDQFTNEIVHEGVEEAEHDQMVRGSRRRKPAA